MSRPCCAESDNTCCGKTRWKSRRLLFTTECACLPALPVFLRRGPPKSKTKAGDNKSRFLILACVSPLAARFFFFSGKQVATPRIVCRIGVGMYRRVYIDRGRPSVFDRSQGATRVTNPRRRSFPLPTPAASHNLPPKTQKKRSRVSRWQVVRERPRRQPLCETQNVSKRY